MTTAIHQFVEQARSGSLDRVICKMNSGWAVLGDPQIQNGYCLLLPDPVVGHLNELQGERRLNFLRDMTTLGDCVLEVTKALRINYEILGNLEPALHAHIIPRFSTENEELRTKPIWSYDWQKAPKFDLEKHRDLMEKLRKSLKE